MASKETQFHQICLCSAFTDVVGTWHALCFRLTSACFHAYGIELYEIWNISTSGADIYGNDHVIRNASALSSRTRGVILRWRNLIARKGALPRRQTLIFKELYSILGNARTIQNVY